jgi:hypothetical protein
MEVVLLIILFTCSLVVTSSVEELRKDKCRTNDGVMTSLQHLHRLGCVDVPCCGHTFSDANDVDDFRRVASQGYKMAISNRKAPSVHGRTTRVVQSRRHLIETGDGYEIAPP